MIRFSYASTKQRDQFYKIRMDITDDFFVLEKDNRTYVFLDSREFDVLKEKNTDSNLEVVSLEPIVTKARLISDTKDLPSKIAITLLQEYGVTAALVPSYFSLDIADYLRIKGITLTVTKPFYPEREFKKLEEVKAIEESIESTQYAFELIEKILTESKIKEGILEHKGIPLTSELLKKEVARIGIEQGLLHTDGMIISYGLHAAIPHHMGQGVIKAHQPIICDLFPVSVETGYFADMTRTYCKGQPTKRIQEMYDAVLKVQELALSMAEPGILACNLYEASCKTFADLGFDTDFDTGKHGFTHALGHGLGLDLHEQPSLNKYSETILQPGHVITIEPGLYYPEHGGVRIEDVICITEVGNNNLTNYHKNLIIE